MWVLERTLSPRFRVITIGYPSRKYPVERLAQYVGERIRRRCLDQERKVHFVTHSLGGIVLRCYLKDNPLHNLGRIVMLGPPNRGSELVDIFTKNALVRALFRVAAGPAGPQLGTETSSVPNALGRVDFELGVIAGNGSQDPLFSRLILGQNDGRLSVERAKVEGMTDFVTVSQHHSFMMYDTEVIEQTVFFLENGKFR
jgi:pimeloyl-ACP methyl ester carboxylesterase